MIRKSIPSPGWLSALFCGLTTFLFAIPKAEAYAIPTVPSGAVCDGTADDTIAFENALSAANSSGGVLEIPAGTCVVNSPLVITGTNVSIVGQGQKISILQTSSNSIPQIVVNASNIVLKHFQLLHTTTTVDGAFGISTYNSTSEPNAGYNGLYIDDVRVLGAHTGFLLYQGNGYVMNSWAENCQGAGFKLTVSTNATISPNYNLWDDTSEYNVGPGFYITMPVAPNLPIVYPGIHRNLYTGNNTGGGYWLEGNSTTQFQDFDLIDSFFGEDGNDEVHIDAGNGTDVFHEKRIANVQTEAAGTEGTGPGMTTPASLVGYGIYISSATAGVDIVGGNDNGDSYSGVYILSPNPVTITGRRELDNGVAGTTYSNGFDIRSSGGIVNITGGFSGNDNSGAYRQQYGLYTSGGATVYATGLVCRLNTAASHSGSVTVTPSGTC